MIWQLDNTCTINLNGSKLLSNSYFCMSIWQDSDVLSCKSIGGIELIVYYLRFHS